MNYQNPKSTLLPSLLILAILLSACASPTPTPQSRPGLTREVALTHPCRTNRDSKLQRLLPRATRRRPLLSKP